MLKIIMNNNPINLKTDYTERVLPVQEAIEHLIRDSKKETILIAIDGKSGGGKTTLGEYLRKIYDCNLFHMDDFFLQSHQRTAERLLEVGGNVDYERFKDEVLIPMKEKKAVMYRPFRCSNLKIDNGILMPYKRTNIIEGSYSMHPYFDNPYDLRIFIEISDEEQLENIRRRNGEEQLIQFKDKWIPKENAYFDKFDIRKGCIIIHF